MTANEIIEYLETFYNEKESQQRMRFFKTGKGQYGEGDHFLGIRNTQIHELVKSSRELPLEEVPTLLTCKWHEVRLYAVLILVDKYSQLCSKRQMSDTSANAKRKEIVTIYLHHTRFINNWDLVDLSVDKILGRWAMENYNEGIKMLDKLAASHNLWEQRMSIVATAWPIRHGDASFCLRYAEKHLCHSHDLMHKATGWMLREMGKQIEMELLRDFLNAHIHEMPRTTLRYAIEKMSDEERHYWLAYNRTN